MSDQVWKMRYGFDAEFFEDEDRLVVALLEAALLNAYNNDASNNSTGWRRRMGIRAWILRGTRGRYEDEKASRLNNPYVRRPQVWTFADGEWQEVEWSLIEPSVTLAVEDR